MEEIRVREIFERYVFGFIKADIEREIDLARNSSIASRDGIVMGGGNVLAALGLVCYTEFLGSFVTGRRGVGWSRRNFEAFLKRMGTCYELLDESICDVYRNGLVHEYAVKQDCTVYMLRGAEDCAIGKAEDGTYYFVVERYFEDLMQAAEVLYGELRQNPVMPS